MFMRKRSLGSGLLAAIMFAFTLPALGQVQTNDLVFGMDESVAEDTLRLIRGPATMTGAAVSDSWNGFERVQSVEFDNLAGIRHNKAGNLLGMDSGSNITGGAIYNYATDGSWASSELLPSGNFSLVFGHTSRTSGLSVSPDNSKIAFAGIDSGRIYVMNYNAGATPGTGAGASLTAATTTTSILTPFSPPLDFIGTTWLNNSTVATFDNTGKLFTVDATTGVHALVTDLTLPNNSNFTSLAYEPLLSPYLYVMWNRFNSSTSTNNNTLYLFDPTKFGNANPADDLVATVDFSGSMNSTREIAFDSEGNLFVGQFKSTSGVGPAVDVILGLAGTAPESIVPNSSVNWYSPSHGAGFTGLDVASSIPPLPAGDFDGDGDVDGADFVVWQTNFPAASGHELATGDADGDADVDGADFALWQESFQSLSGQQAAPVPEPAAWILMGLLLPALRVFPKSRRV
jgi:hypothetical protein